MMPIELAGAVKGSRPDGVDQDPRENQALEPAIDRPAAEGETGDQIGHEVEREAVRELLPAGVLVERDGQRDDGGSARDRIVGIPVFVISLSFMSGYFFF